MGVLTRNNHFIIFVRLTLNEHGKIQCTSLSHLSASAINQHEPVLSEEFSDADNKPKCAQPKPCHLIQAYRGELAGDWEVGGLRAERRNDWRGGAPVIVQIRQYDNFLIG